MQNLRFVYKLYKFNNSSHEIQTVIIITIILKIDQWSLGRKSYEYHPMTDHPSDSHAGTITKLTNQSLLNTAQ